MKFHKNKSVRILTIIGSLSLLSIIFAGASSYFFDSKSVSALGTYRSTTPTTIDPSNATDAQIRSYYSSLNGLAIDERKGNNLLKNLKPILASGSYYYSYAKTWDVFMITDRDWVQSPLASYSGYSYSDNPYVRLLYRNDNGTPTAAHFNDTHGTYIDREHVWPQSRGFGADPATGPAGTDVHHLILGDSVNNQQGHSNYAWGDEDHGITPTPIGTAARHNNTGIRWTATDKFGGSDNIYEPQDSDKGDIARAVFYMAARYNNWAGTTGAISNSEPFLQVTDEIYDSGEGTVYSTDTTPINMGILSTLLKWHEQDPVDSYEIHRNNLIYYNFQNNRNPFIDFPEWVDAVYGSESKYATPASDVINGYNQTNSLITNITLNHETLTLTSGGSTATLSADILPVDATNKYLNWTSNNEAVATVSNGVVTPLDVGTATISAAATDGSGVSDTCQVTVVAEYEKVLEYIEVTNYSGTASFGSTYNTDGIVVTAHYDDYSFETVSGEATINEPDTLVLGEQTISVTYGGKTTYYIVDVTNEGAVFAPSQATDLIISEYIEGSSSNKYIEIYNKTGGVIDLSDYKLQLFSNGAITPSSDVALSGTLNDGAAKVYKNSSAALSLPAGVSADTNSAVNFNGDDAVALYKISTSSFVDIFGVIGVDPGSAWSGGGVTTVDVTLVRKSSVSSGITTNPETPETFDPSAEWVQYATDTASYLGSHTMTLSPAVTDLDQAEAWATYFLNETSTQCQLLAPQDEDDWLRLEDEYDYMTVAAKAYYTEGGATSIIISAIARYQAIISAHPENEPFIAGLPTGTFVSISTDSIEKTTLIILVLVSGIGLAFFLVLVAKNKKNSKEV